MSGLNEGRILGHSWAPGKLEGSCWSLRGFLEFLEAVRSERRRCNLPTLPETLKGKTLCKDTWALSMAKSKPSATSPAFERARLANLALILHKTALRHSMGNEVFTLPVVQIALCTHQLMSTGSRGWLEAFVASASSKGLARGPKVCLGTP